VLASPILCPGGDRKGGQGGLARPLALLLRTLQHGRQPAASSLGDRGRMRTATTMFEASPAPSVMAPTCDGKADW
jgi:hypothetical protein